MFRFALACVAMAILALTAGCSMCAHPYDTCGPTFTGKCGGTPCAPGARAGSILSPSLPVPGSQSISEQPTPESDKSVTPVPAGAQPADQQSTQRQAQQSALKRWAIRPPRNVQQPPAQ